MNLNKKTVGVCNKLKARSERTTGNYSPGEENADKYAGHEPYAENTTDRYIPNLTKLYYPGNEVFNTTSDTCTTLVIKTGTCPKTRRLACSLRFADVRLSYYDTEIEDFIDRDFYYNVIQFDEKKPPVSNCNSASILAGFTAAWVRPTG